MKQARQNEIIVDGAGEFFGYVCSEAAAAADNDGRLGYEICSLEERRFWSVEDLDAEGCRPAGIILNKKEIRMCLASCGLMEEIDLLMWQPTKLSRFLRTRKVHAEMYEACSGLGMKAESDMAEFAAEYLEKKLAFKRKNRGAGRNAKHSKKVKRGGAGSAKPQGSASARGKRGIVGVEGHILARRGGAILDAEGVYFGRVYGLVSGHAVADSGSSCIIYRNGALEFWTGEELAAKGCVPAAIKLSSDDMTLCDIYFSRKALGNELLKSELTTRSFAKLRHAHGVMESVCPSLGMEKDGNLREFVEGYISKKFAADRGDAD